jgi:hypothetical protein
MRAGLLALLFATSQALACGVCVEDKIAAVYDHAPCTRLWRRSARWCSSTSTGKLVADERTKRAMLRHCPRDAGVDRERARLVRTRIDGASLRRKTHHLVKVQENLEKRLSAQGLSLLAMQVREH